MTALEGDSVDRPDIAFIAERMCDRRGWQCRERVSVSAVRSDPSR